MKTISSRKDFFIPAGMTVTGTLTSDEPGEIAGIINGDVFVNGRLLILKGAVVNGNVKAQELEIWGSVTGCIQCSGKLILQKASIVNGNIRGADIQIDIEVVVDGVPIQPGHYKSGQGFVPTTQKEYSRETNKEVKTETKDEAGYSVTDIPVPDRIDDTKKQSWF